MPMMPSHAAPSPAYPEADRYDARMASGRNALTKATGIGPSPEPGLMDKVLNFFTGYPLPGEVATGSDVAAAGVGLVPGMGMFRKLAGGSMKGAALGGEALGSLAATLKGGAGGEYALRAPTAERLRDIYRIGTNLPTTSNWAGSANEELLRAFGGDQAKALQWARLWGATSPNTSVPRNTKESVSALIHALESGAPLTVEDAQAGGRLANHITMAPSKVPNINRALAGEPLGGDKVEAMAGFMAGQPRIPIDVHALYALGSDTNKLNPEIKALRALMADTEGLPLRSTKTAKGLTNTDIYLRYENALRNTLQEFAPTRDVNQVFAELWEGARAHKGLKPQGGPIDILRNKGLLELGAMLDPERLRAVLTQSGWTAPAIAGLLATMGMAGTDGEGIGP
jgi:hypothetical protein